MKNYIHGYSEKESERLYAQADVLQNLLHHDSIFKKGSEILEVGCGTGAQTRVIASINPDCKITSFDISEESLKEAEKTVSDLNLKNVSFECKDLNFLDYEEEHFDYIFICFVLEHISDPVRVLKFLKKFLKKDGKIILIEGDHGSAYFYPYSDFAKEVIDCQIQLQFKAKGNALIGRQLYPILRNAGFKDCYVTPRMVYADGSNPDVSESFTINTFTAMIEGIKDIAVEENLISPVNFEKGIRDLKKAADHDGVFCYTFFKAIASK